MEKVQGITVCHACKAVFNGIITGPFSCPDCQSKSLALLSNMGIYDAVKAYNPGSGCPNLIDGICELTGEDVW